MDFVEVNHAWPSSRTPSEHSVATTNSELRAAMAQALDTPSLLPSVQEEPVVPIRAKHSFNIMFVGESGLGKSTFQRDIFHDLDPTWMAESDLQISVQVERRATLLKRIEHKQYEITEAARAGEDLLAQRLLAEKRDLERSQVTAECAAPR